MKRVRLSKTALKQLRAIPNPFRGLIKKKLRSLAASNKHIRLAESQYCKSRVGKYRIIYLNNEEEILVAKITKRSRAYQ